MMAAPLSEGLSQLTNEEWVDFSITTFRGKSMIGSFRQTDGVMFFKDGGLNIAVRNVSEKKSPDRELNSYDPTKGYRSLSKLAQIPGTELKDKNWIVFDLKNILHQRSFNR